MKTWNEVLEFLAQIGCDQQRPAGANGVPTDNSTGNSTERIQEIRIKKYEKNKWTVSITKERNASVGIHDMFW